MSSTSWTIWARKNLGKHKPPKKPCQAKVRIWTFARIRTKAHCRAARARQGRHAPLARWPAASLDAMIPNLVKAISSGFFVINKKTQRGEGIQSAALIDKSEVMVLV